MFKNYFKITMRNLLKDKVYSLITIFGLAIGMASFLLILSFIEYEKSYDNFHVNGDHIYAVHYEKIHEGWRYSRVFTGAPLLPRLQQEFPSVKNAVRFANFFTCLVSVNEDAFKEKSFLFSDNSVFNMFTFPLQTGNSETALKKPFTVVITPQTAKKYFGDENPIGRTLYFQTKECKGKFAFTVTGVTKDIPSNSTIKFNFLASFSSLRSIAGNYFMDRKWEAPVWSYIQLDQNSPGALEALFPDFVNKYITKTDDSIKNIKLLPLKNTYYTKVDGMPISDYGFKVLSYALLFITFVVLIIACINFTNLLSARSVTRAREIGVRKVQGANRWHLIRQFIGESVIISLFSLVVAIFLVELLLPAFHSFLSDVFPTFNMVAARQVDFGIMNIKFLIYMLITSLLVGVLSGIYPALVLSKINAAVVIKGEMREGISSAWFRKLLVISQYAVAVIFIVCSLHIFNLIHSMKNSDTGFDKKNVLTIPIYDNSVKEKYDILKTELIRNPNISGVTASDLIPGGFDSRGILFRSEEIEDFQISPFYVDFDFVKTMGIKISAGRDFSKNISGDSKSAFLLNQGAMQEFGWNEVRGQEIDLYIKRKNKRDTIYSGQLIGVMEDFNHRAFIPNDKPIIVKIAPKSMNYILIKINNRQAKKTIAYIKSTWNTLNADQAFEFSYLNDEINTNYTIFDAIDSIIRFASILTILIACLGLFALASFVIERKTKEIGIRKVLGASEGSIVFKLSKSFILLVIFANVIAWPVSYKIVTSLQENSIRLDTNIWLFLAATVISVSISMAAVGFKAQKAARANPVESLRYE